MARSATTARNNDDHVVAVFLDAVARALAEMDAERLRTHDDADGGAVGVRSEVGSSTADKEA